MSDLRPTGTKIRLGNKEYSLLFTLNAIEDIQTKFNVPIGQIDELLHDGTNQVSNIKYIITLLINEDIDRAKDETGIETPHVDERFTGRHVNLGNLGTLMSCIYKAIGDGTPAGGDEDPNPKSEQQKN